MVGGDWGGRQLVAKQAGLRWVRASCPAAGIDLCLPRLWAAHGLSGPTLVAAPLRNPRPADKAVDA